MKTLQYILAAVMLLTFASCSSEDVPDNNALTGEKMVENIKSLVLDENGEIDFYPSAEVEGLYAVDVNNYEAAKNICSQLIHNEWDGKELTYLLPDNCGKVKLTPGYKEGVWCTAILNVKTIPSFTLEVVTSEYLKKDNYISPPRPPKKEFCKNCGWSLTQQEIDNKNHNRCGYTW